MFEYQLWHNKIVNKNVKGAKIMGLNTIFDQHPQKFNIGHFFISPVKL